MSRIINRQRQLAEQGRIRLGYTTEAANGKTRPVRSETFILTSHSKDHIDHAASLWGGTVEHWQPMGNGAKQYRVITEATAIPAILPPGDPLTQAYEMWSKGGCQRRCDGGTEQFSGSPCLCLAEHGETWFELGPRDVCQSKSRLKVLLPDMQGLGSWRMETGSFYATDEIAGMVDTIRGAVGESVLVPVSLRIEQRTRVADGRTKHFVVPVLELRGVTAGALLSGEATTSGALSSGRQERPALESGQTAQPQQASDTTTPNLPTVDDIAAATSRDVLASIWKFLGAHNARTPELEEALNTRAAELQQQAESAQPEPDAEGVVDAEIVPDAAAADDGDADAVWQQCLAAGGERGMGLSEVTHDFEQRYASPPGEASAGELRVFLEALRSEQAVPA